MIIAYGIFGGLLVLMLVFGAISVSADRIGEGIGPLILAGWCGVIGIAGLAVTAVTHLVTVVL